MTTPEDISSYSWVNWGAKVMVARNAFEGLDAIKNTHPDLVLSDIQMPGMDGFELLDEIRALGSDGGGSVPVIAMSAFFSETDRKRTAKELREKAA